MMDSEILLNENSQIKCMHKKVRNYKYSCKTVNVDLITWYR